MLEKKNSYPLLMFYEWGEILLNNKKSCTVNA